jgi:hypothetical protein
MSDNRSQDIRLIKLAINIEKEAAAFFDKFIQRAGASALTAFLQTMKDGLSEDISRFEALLQPLLDESGAGGNIEGLSLDEYVKEVHGPRGGKFFSAGRARELIEGLYNPIQTLEAAAQVFREISKFYLDSSADIFYEKEKTAFLESAERKKEQSENVARKRREIISRFP